MNLNLDLTVGHLITLGLAFFAALWCLVKIIGVQNDRRLSEKFDTLTKSLGTLSQELKDEAIANRKLETSFLQFQAELSRDYVRRDDFLRAVGVIETRIDNFAFRMERVLLSKQPNGGSQS